MAEVIPMGITVKEKPDTVSKEEVSSWFNNIHKKYRDKTIPSDEALALINISLQDDSLEGIKFKDTMQHYANILEIDGVNFIDYLNAIRFCSFLELEEGNATRAYIKAFSYREWVQERMDLPTDDPKYNEIRGAASRYRKYKTVQAILKQAEIPLYLLFQGYRYKAVEVLVDEMQNAHLSKDRIAAANTLLTHVKPPENVQIELNVGKKEDDIVTSYEAMLNELAKKQKELIENGVKASEVANIKAIEAEIVE